MVEFNIPDGPVTFGDYDRDGADDIAVSSRFGLSQNRLEILRFNPQSESLEILHQRNDSPRAFKFYPAHVDDDGRLDLLYVWTDISRQVAVREDHIEVGPEVTLWNSMLSDPIDIDGDRRTEYVGARYSTIRIFTVDLAGGTSILPSRKHRAA